MNNAPAPRSSCYRCAHFHITFDPRHPYGCHAMGFKSQRLPEAEVSEAAGHACLCFTPKTVKRR